LPFDVGLSGKGFPKNEKNEQQKKAFQADNDVLAKEATIEGYFNGAGNILIFSYSCLLNLPEDDLPEGVRAVTVYKPLGSEEMSMVTLPEVF